jgi:hypothetical protein
VRDNQTRLILGTVVLKGRYRLTSKSAGNYVHSVVEKLHVAGYIG